MQIIGWRGRNHISERQRGVPQDVLDCIKIHLQNYQSSLIIEAMKALKFMGSSMADLAKFPDEARSAKPDIDLAAKRYKLIGA